MACGTARGQNTPFLFFSLKLLKIQKKKRKPGPQSREQNMEFQARSATHGLGPDPARHFPKSAGQTREQVHPDPCLNQLLLNIFIIIKLLIHRPYRYI